MIKKDKRFLDWIDEEYVLKTGTKLRARDRNFVIESLFSKKTDKYILTKLKERIHINLLDDEDIVISDNKTSSITDTNKLLIVSSWNVQCGIATYTSYLVNELDKYYNINIIPVTNILKDNRIYAKGLLNLQYEFGIFNHKIPKTEKDTKKVITWHTVNHNSVFNADAHIVHSEEAKSILDKQVNDTVYHIPHGSYTFPKLKQRDARTLLKLPKNAFIILVFGMRTPDKQYERILQIINELKKHNTEILCVFTSAPHQFETPYWKDYYVKYIKKRTNGMFIHKWLSELEVTLYAIASDLFLFNYKPMSDNASSSGALHRIIGAGKPIICNNKTLQFDELINEETALKFKDNKDAISKINLVINDKHLANRLGRNAKRYAKETSWHKIAKQYKAVFDEII